MRVQVTDLSLPTVEEQDRVRFVVTSLSTGKPVAGAGSGRRRRARRAGRPCFSGNDRQRRPVRLGGAGARSADVTADPPHRRRQGRRHAGARADPRAGRLRRQNWLVSRREPGCNGRQHDLGGRAEPDAELCHVFTERPIYRPEEPVHIKGYRPRTTRRRRCSIEQGRRRIVVITGPTTRNGGMPVDARRRRQLLPPVRREDRGDRRLSGARRDRPSDGDDSAARCSFKKEAYRLPTFEVLLNGPTKTSAGRAVPGRA